MTVSTQPPDRRAWVDVDLANLLANARTVRAAARHAALLPMVKADAYGLGAVPVARALETLQPWGYGVATLEEGAELREAGITRPILVFTPAGIEQLDRYRRLDLRAVLDDPDIADRWPLPFHLEVDSGMGRCGVRWDQPERLAAMASPHLEGAFTHFASADERAQSVGAQWERFASALARLPSRPRLVHAANSAGAWRLDERLDLVRPGIFLYGGRAAPDLPAPKPVATLRAPVVSVRTVQTGDTISYGGEWSAPVPTTIATLGVGYADGVPRAATGHAQVLLHGTRRNVVGRVTMDFIMVDAGPEAVDTVRVGDVATLIGRDGGDEIDLETFAAWSGTISYELLTRLRMRLERRYRGP